jgi:hypothetical protein
MAASETMAIGKIGAEKPDSGSGAIPTGISEKLRTSNYRGECYD